MAKAIKKTAAIALAAGLTFAGSAGFAAQDAFAQTRATEPALATQVPDVAIPEGKVFSLNVNKKINPTELRNGTGQADDKVSGTPLNGVTFKLEKLEGDIRNQDTFNELAKLSQDYNKAGADKSSFDLNIDSTFQTQTKETEGQGVASFTGLPAGAYLVTETDQKGATKATPVDGDAANGTEYLVPAEPFIVFLPMTNPQGNGWINEVNVYPKNSFARAEKAVVDQDKHAVDKETRDSVTYTLTGIVPAAKEGEKLDWFGLRDAYNNAEIKPDIDNLTVEVQHADGSKTTLDKGKKEFAVGADNGYNSVNDDNLAQGANAGFFVGVDTDVLKPGDKVIVTVKAQLLKGANTDQQIENSVREYFRSSKDDTGFSKVPPETPPNTPPGDTPPPNETPNDKVTTYVGKITVYKRGEEKKALQGAEFSVGKCNADKKDIDGDVIATGTTGEDGTLIFNGLHVTDYVDDADVPETEQGTYCVKETKAPSGYSLPDNAVTPLTLTRQDHIALNGKNETAEFEAVADGTTIENGVVIDNVKKTVPLLPSTGGMGILIVALAGLAIIGGGAYAARRNSQSA